MIQEIAIALLALFLILALLLAYEDDQFGGRVSQLKTKMKRSVRQMQDKVTPASLTDSGPTSQSLSTQAPPSKIPTSSRTAIPVPVKTTQTNTTRTAIPQSRQRLSASRRRSTPMFQEDQLRTARQSVVQRDLDDQMRTARPVNRAQASGNPPPDPRSAGGKDKKEQKRQPSDSDPQPRSDDKQPSSDAQRSSNLIKPRRHHSRHRTKAERGFRQQLIKSPAY